MLIIKICKTDIIVKQSQTETKVNKVRDKSKSYRDKSKPCLRERERM